MNTDTFQTIIPANSATDGTTAVMVLPTVTSTAPQNEAMHQQVQTVFSYPPLMSSNQSVLLPVTPGVQIIPSSKLWNICSFCVTDL